MGSSCFRWNQFTETGSPRPTISSAQIKTPPSTEMNDGAFELSLFRGLFLSEVTCSKCTSQSPQNHSKLFLAATFKKGLGCTAARADGSDHILHRIRGQPGARRLAPRLVASDSFVRRQVVGHIEMVP